MSTLYCPVAGVRVHEDPRWVNQQVTETLSANFWVVDRSIIYSLPKGRASLEGVRGSLAINDDVVHFVSGDGKPHIQIEDYAFVSGSDAEARRYFTSRMDNCDSLDELIFCNLSPALAIAVNIGKRLNTQGKNIHVVKDYSEAVELALELEGDFTPSSDLSAIDLRAYVDPSIRHLSPVRVLTDKSWGLHTDQFSFTLALIDNSILHSRSEGVLRLEHVPQIEERRSRCLAALPEGTSIDYILVDGSGLVGSERAARGRYMQSIAAWHEDNPFKMYIGYGATAFMRASMRLARPLMPFKVVVAKDIERAFERIREHRNGSVSQKPSAARKKRAISVEAAEMEKVAAFIANIRWESQGTDIDMDIDVDAGHPLFLMYQSIMMLKEELDQLFVERGRFEARLHQAWKMETVGTIAAGVAHDFNNILAIISGNADLALLETAHDDSVRESIESIRNAAVRAEDIVKQLLNFSRQAEQDLRPIDLVATIKDAVRLMRATIPCTIDINVDLPDSVAMVLGDPTQIHQVLLNLCTNAAHAMSTGGVLNIDVVEETTSNGTGPAIHPCVTVTVSDMGKGIEEQHLDRIFDPYFTTKKFGEGSGMGLSVVLGIVRSHGGTIDVDSEPGKGSTFTLRFPAFDEESLDSTR